MIEHFISTKTQKLKQKKGHIRKFKINYKYVYTVSLDERSFVTPRAPGGVRGIFSVSLPLA